jgi:hypothetical protein
VPFVDIGGRRCGNGLAAPGDAPGADGSLSRASPASTKSYDPIPETERGFLKDGAKKNGLAER